MIEINENHFKKIINIIPVLAILPLIIGIFFKLGYLIPFDLKFLITSFSYSELALSSYSSVLFALVSLFGTCTSKKSPPLSTAVSIGGRIFILLL